MLKKKQRLARILEIIKSEDIEKQEELVDRLNQCGFDVTQATVSRDIRDLRLVKEQTISGVQKYAASSSKNDIFFSKKLHEIFAHSVTNIDYANNIVVIKTLGGMAQGAASAVDTIFNSNIVGSIAGDDTVMVIVRSEADAKDMCIKLLELRG